MENNDAFLQKIRNHINSLEGSNLIVSIFPMIHEGLDCNTDIKINSNFGQYSFNIFITMIKNINKTSPNVHIVLELCVYEAQIYYILRISENIPIATTLKGMLDDPYSLDILRCIVYHALLDKKY